jgi:DNA-directed RNA polymerase specialized sigma24 family protein
VTFADIRAAQAGDRRASERICRELTPKLEAMAADFRYPGAERDDVVQWGWLGVLGGIRVFKADRSPDPAGFLLMCARRWMKTGLKVQTRQRAQVLNKAERVVITEDGGDIAIGELIPDPASDIVEILALQQELRKLAEEIAKLTPLERRAVLGLAYGYSYDELEASESGAVKQIDNAIQRARVKLRRAA